MPEDDARVALVLLRYERRMKRLEHLRLRETAEIILAAGAYVLAGWKVAHVSSDFVYGSMFRVVVQFSLLVGVLLSWHFWSRQDGYRWTMARYRRFLLDRGEGDRMAPAEKRLSVVLPAGAILVMTLGLLLTVAKLSAARAEAVIAEVGLFLVLFVPALVVGAEIGQSYTLRGQKFVYWPDTGRGELRFRELVDEWPGVGVCLIGGFVLSALITFIMWRLLSAPGAVEGSFFAVKAILIATVLVGMDVGGKLTFRRQVRITYPDGSQERIPLGELPGKFFRGGERIGIWRPEALH